MALPDARLKFYRRAKALCSLCEDESSGVTAKRVALAVLCLWQEKKFPTLRAGLRRPYGTSELVEMPQVMAFANWLAEHDDFSVAAYWLASAYAIWVGDATRTKRSLYFTPPQLAQRVIKDLLSSGASLSIHTWHDPACGGAAFLVPVAQCMANELQRLGHSSEEILQHIERHLSGSDLEGALLELSREFLRMALYDFVTEAGRLPNFDLQIGNGLLLAQKRQHDVVICNPPYRKLQSDEASGYSPTFDSVIEGQPNIYGLFVYRSMEIASAGGLVGLLTPTSFLSGQNFSKLRTAILCKAQPLRIDILSSRKATFIDVEQETAIMIVRTGTPIKPPGRSIAVAIRTEGSQFEEIGCCSLPSGGRPWPIPKSAEDVNLIRAAEESSSRLLDYGYKARIGNLVDYRDERRRFSRPPKSALAQGIFPLIWATDITSEGRLQHGRTRRGNRNELYVEVGNTKQSGVIRKPSIVMQRVTSTEQPRRLVCADIPLDWLTRHSGFVAENHVIVIEQIDKAEPLIDTVTLAAILRSSTVDRLFRSISGASNVSVYELDELPLPSADIFWRELKLGRAVESAILSGYGMLAPKNIAA